MPYPIGRRGRFVSSVCLLFCLDERLCPACRRSAVYSEEFFPESGCADLCAGDASAPKGKIFAPERRTAVPADSCSCGTTGILCNFYAIDHLALSDASILNKMSPFFVILCSWLILKEKLTWQQGMIVLGAFVGSLFVIKPSFSNAALFPSLIGLLGGLGAGVAYAMVRKLGQIGENKTYIVFFFSAFSCVVTLPYLLLAYEPMTWKQLLILVMAGLSAAGGQFGITSAYCYAPAKDISVYDYTQILFAAGLGFLLFAQIPDWMSLAGYLIIITMGVLMFLYQRRDGEKEKSA